ncbi:MAG: alpha/beta hydrolase [Thermoleophilia bacterium]|nr:alpha/beta hydrolase [Thermoleophilia bacterium]MDH5333303.1 alpha/beta hydrolase [Thermoleophilia bacterium]
MQRLVLVHGSVTAGRATWATQRRALRDRFTLAVLDRPGFPPGPPVDRVDFEEHAAWVADRLQTGDHLVGHSYGGVVCLLAAARRPDLLASLTVVEPPAGDVARGDPDVDRFVREGEAWWAAGPTDDAEAFLRGFLRYVGSAYEPPSPLPPELAQGALTLIVERHPWEARIPLAALAAAPFPKLVVSGAHHAAFDAICDALERGLGAERLVLPGHGHSPHRHPAFDEALARFVDAAAENQASG